MKSSPDEDTIIAFIKRLTASKSSIRGLTTGIGDDAAVFSPKSGGELLFTTDSLVEGVHFEKEWMSPSDLGRKLGAVNLSDIAAMGGKPLFALLSLGIPPSMDTSFIKRFVRGVVEILHKYGAVLGGGNISGNRRNFTADLSLVGSCPKGHAWKRSCAPGRDAIVVVGDLGSARAGLELIKKGGGTRGFSKLVKAFKRPEPLVRVAEFAADKKAVHGAIDVSDGFAKDLVRMCEAVGCGCEVDASKLPISKELVKFCKNKGAVPLKYALSGGEDYALILSVSKRKAAVLVDGIKKFTGYNAAVVGRFVAKKKSCTLLAGGKRGPLYPRGWDHLTHLLF